MSDEMFPTYLLGKRPDPDVCVCGQLIADNAVYYAFPLSEDNDAPYAYVNEWHGACLEEWGWERDPDPDNWLGIRHASTYCVEEADETIRPVNGPCPG